MENDFEKEVEQAKQVLIDWLVEAGAELFSLNESDDGFEDEDDEEFSDELSILLLDDVEYYVGPATCDTSSFDEWVTDKDFKMIAVSRNGHHHFEIASIPVLGSPLSLEVLRELVQDLRPDEPESYVKVDDYFSDGSMKTSFCDPFDIEVRDDGGSNNVWVVRRFRVDDVAQPNFGKSMREVIDLVGKVREQVLS